MQSLLSLTSTPNPGEKISFAPAPAMLKFEEDGIITFKRNAFIKNYSI